MKNFNVKAFGITRDILGEREKVILAEAATVGEFKAQLLGQYPDLVKLRSLVIAVNGAYADEKSPIMENDEIALIPPVSGG